MIELVDKYDNAIPKALESSIGKVVLKTKVYPTSVYRGTEAAAILNRHGKHTQPQICAASPSERAAMGVIGTPDCNNDSTHQCFSDGVAFKGPVGRKIEDGQCGMDWPDPTIWEVMKAFREIGERPFHPYASGVEYHHVNLLEAPGFMQKVLPLKYGSRWNQTIWVYVLSSRLVKTGYLAKRSPRFTKAVEEAVKKYQHHHHMHIDGVVGEHTWTALKASVRWTQKHHKKEI